MITPDRLIVLIPAHNEAATVGAIVAQIRALWGCPVVVIDDCSTDRTAQVARTAGAVVLPLTLQLGAWGASRPVCATPCATTTAPPSPSTPMVSTNLPALAPCSTLYRLDLLKAMNSSTMQRY